MDTWIWLSNLQTALSLAIEKLEQIGQGKSTLAEGYREVLQDLKDGKVLRIKDYDL